MKASLDERTSFDAIDTPLPAKYEQELSMSG